MNTIETSLVHELTLALGFDEVNACQTRRNILDQLSGGVPKRCCSSGGSKRCFFKWIRRLGLA